MFLRNKGLRCFMDAFVAMRKILSVNTGIVQRLETVEQKQIETDKKIDKIFNALESKDVIPKTYPNS